jgi:hypothetical protein
LGKAKKDYLAFRKGFFDLGRLICPLLYLFASTGFALTVSGGLPITGLAADRRGI